jgi:hypothetical protein
VVRRLIALVGLALAVVWGAWIRVDTTLSDPYFDARDARGLLRSDPALLAYLTQEIEAAYAAGRATPPDFRADPRIQHPFVTDVPEEFPVAQEFLVAGAHRFVAPDTPLHVVALWVSSFVAALFVLGTFLAVRAFTRSDGWAALGALLALLTPACYRTIGFLWVGEDLALTLFALHGGWLARAARTRSAPDFLLAGGFAAGALATWHASSFVLTLELGVLVLALLVRGKSPLETPRAWLVLVPPALAGLAVPVLRASGLLVSPAAALALALLVPALVARRGALAPGRVRLMALGALLAGLLASAALAPGSYAHVHEVVLAKLRFLGRFPADPTELSFDARLLWQGPFETLAPADVVRWCGWPLALLAAAALAVLVRRRAAGEASAAELVLAALALATLPAAWMFARLAVLAGLFLPVVGVVALAHLRARGLTLVLALLLAQAGVFAAFVRGHSLDWYLPPPARAELVRLIAWVEQNVAEDEPILGDFVNSTALLAHARRPIVLQPKYETDRSRRQAEAFLTTFFHGTPAELAELMRARFRSPFLLVDGYVLGSLSRATAGLRADEPLAPGSAAAALLAEDDATLEGVPELELLYRSAPGIEGADYRVFRLR